METQGIVIWARSGAGALIVWCADNAALVYVADRRSAGDPDAALSVGDFVALRVEVRGAMRVGRDLRYRSAGAGWLRGALARDGAEASGPVMSPHPRIARSLGVGPGVAADAAACVPANGPKRSGTGAA